MRVSAPHTEQSRSSIRIVVDVIEATTKRELWYEVPAELSDHLSLDRSDAFMTGLALECMHRGVPLQVEGAVSPTLLSGLRYYNRAMKSLFPKIHLIEIEADEQKLFDLPKLRREVGAGFSAGVDAMCTAFENHQVDQLGHRIDRFVYVNVGSHGKGEAGRLAFEKRSQLVRRATDEIGVPLITIDSNINEFLSSKYDFSYVPFIVSCVQLLQKLFHTYLIASSNTYSDLCPDGSTPLTDHLLSTDTLQIIHDGAQHRRIDKIAQLARWNLALKHLNVCREPRPDFGNCSQCTKCAWVMIAADMLGLQQEYSQAFDFSLFEEAKDKFVRKKMIQGTASPNYYWRELVRFAEETGYPLLPAQPTLPVAATSTARTLAKSSPRDSRERLLVFRRQEANFGDRISEAILRSMGYNVDCAPAAHSDLAAAGSLLQFLPESYQGTVLGSGFQEEYQARTFPRANLLAVRGRLSADRCRAPEECLLADPGLLVGILLPELPPIQRTMTIIPHINDQGAPHLHAICQKYGNQATLDGEWQSSDIAVVNLRAEPLHILKLIASSEYVLSSSLYGLIAAEALGKPCRWLVLSRHVPGGLFKFQDYYSAFDRNQQPALLNGTETLRDLINLTQRPPSQLLERTEMIYELFRQL